jgi:hypothetical protein
MATSQRAPVTTPSVDAGGFCASRRAGDNIADAEKVEIAGLDFRD